MQKSSLFFQDICVNSNSNDLGIFFLFVSKIIWISYTKNRFIQINFSKKTNYFWKNSFNRNSLLIEKDFFKHVTFSGFSDHYIPHISFFLKKFNLKILIPIYNHEHRNVDKILVSERKYCRDYKHKKFLFASNLLKLITKLKKKFSNRKVDDLIQKMRKKNLKNKKFFNCSLTTLLFLTNEKKFFFLNFRSNSTLETGIKFFLFKKYFGKITESKTRILDIFILKNFEFFILKTSNRSLSMIFTSNPSLKSRALIFAIFDQKEEETLSEIIFLGIWYKPMIKIRIKKFFVAVLMFLHQKTGNGLNLNFNLKN